MPWPRTSRSPDSGGATRSHRLVVLLVFTAVIAIVYVATRPVPISSERAESVSSFGLGRDALVASAGSSDWTERAEEAGFTGRVGG